MRLSNKERRVLAAVELDAEKSMKQLRRDTGFRDHTIRYCLQRLTARGVIARRPFINLYPLGYVDYAIYFSVVSEKEVMREKLLDELAASPQVSWLATLGGDYQYGIAVCARHHHEVVQFMDKVSTRFPGIFFDRALSLRVIVSLLPRKYLFENKCRLEPVSFGGIPRAVQIDKKDEQILSGLEHGTYTSHRDLARQLNMPISSFEHRLKRLEEEGIVAGYVYRIDSALIGMQHFRLLVFGRGASIRLRKRLYEFSQQHPNIVYYIECLGDWDYELGVEVEQAEEVVRLTEALYRNFAAELNSIKILPLFGHRKISNFPFVVRGGD